MPYADFEKRRARAREYRRQKGREDTKATLPHANYVSTPGKRAEGAARKREAIAKAAAIGAMKGGRAAALLHHVPAPIVLSPVNIPTLDEQDAKYGPL